MIFKLRQIFTKTPVTTQASVVGKIAMRWPKKHGLRLERAIELN